MKKKMLLSAVAMLLAAGTLSAAEFDFANGGSIKFKGNAVPASAPAASAAKSVGNSRRAEARPAEWTIMVFLNGKNNLEKFALRDVNEMEMIGSTDKVNVVVQIGRMDGFDSSDGDWKGVRRYYIKKDEDPTKINSPLIEDLGSLDMGDYKNAIAFGRWAKTKFPAKKYMFIFWNHGSGWVKSKGLYTSKGISYDDETNNHMDTPQMSKVIRDIGGVNVVASDACLMQMAEVAFELKPFAPYIVGSEEIEPGDGYTYDTLLGSLVKNPMMNGAQLAKLAVDAYSDHYESLGSGYTQSFINSASMAQFLTLVNTFTTAVMSANDGEAAKYARDNALKFEYVDNKDLYHFVSLLVEKSNSQAVKAKGKALMSFITSNLVGHSRSKDAPPSIFVPQITELSKAKGIAIYVPNRSVPPSYLEMQWAKKSNWPKFVKWIASKDAPPEGYKPQ